MSILLASMKWIIQHYRECIEAPKLLNLKAVKTILSPRQYIGRNANMGRRLLKIESGLFVRKY